MSRVEQFHNWLLKINNIYATDTERLERAFKIIENSPCQSPKN